MFVGFDYGTSNCAMGVMAGDGVRLLPLDGDSNYLSSTLYALDRDLIATAVARELAEGERQAYAGERSTVLARARRISHELDLLPDEPLCFVGQAGIDAYLDEPGEGYFVKSPKSFLGATGLLPPQIALFEDIVTRMMISAKQQAERQLQGDIRQAVIGRPVNFQGIGGEESNRQAEKILATAARRAGFREVEFLFEPLAAGIDYETGLIADQTVLVVDVGGGTTDCSVVRMGPSHVGNADRSSDFLGHSGRRIGGNDLDIHLALHSLMPLCGLNSQMQSGIPVPSQPFWNAVSINDVAAQTEFNSRQMKDTLKRLVEGAEQPALLRRLLSIQSQQQSYQVVRAAELCKIGLTDRESVEADLGFVESALTLAVSRKAMAEAINRPMEAIVKLMHEALAQAQTRPDVIYVTGGTAKSPVISNAIRAEFCETPIVIGDHFGSVTGGLTKWAAKRFG